jgi:predicted GNAT family acetyltransferase
VLVALIASTLVGTAEYVQKADRVYVQGVAIHPEYRGRGICRALVRKAEEIARKVNVPVLALCAIEEAGNVQIFEKLGFRIMNHSVAPNHVSPAGDPVTQVDMEREVAYPTNQADAHSAVLHSHGLLAPLDFSGNENVDSKSNKQPNAAPSSAYTSPALEWIKVLLPVLLSWPVVGLTIALLFSAPIGVLVERFTQSQEGAAELGPLKITLGKPVLPPQYRDRTKPVAKETIDLSTLVGPIGDTGDNASTVGFAVMYAIRAAQASIDLKTPPLSPWGIYSLARKYDEYEGERDYGSSIIGALMGAKAVGVYAEKDWPYASEKTPTKPIEPLFKIKDFEQCKSVVQILNALRAGKVVAAAIYVTDDFDNPGETGVVVIKLPVERDILGLKAIAITGYDSSSAEFKFANDWGAQWGDHGFGRIKDSDLAELLVDGYTVDL